jgi:hypothetical protein
MAATAQQVVVLKDGVAAVSLTSPKPQNLSSGATLNVTLPSATMNAEASASVGRDEGANGYWHKDAAQVDAKVEGPFDSSLSLSGGQELNFAYRSPASIGSPGASSHLVRSERQTAGGSLGIPVEGVKVEVGAEHSTNQSQDATSAQQVSPVVRTQGSSAFARAEYPLAPSVKVEAGVAARTSDITWRDGHARSSTYRSLDPHVAVDVTPWENASVSARVEQTVAPYDTAAFASYSQEQAPDAPALEPDHAWQLQVRMKQSYGPATLSASYTASRSGTATEYAPAENGAQTPASTPLKSRDSFAVALAVPLASIGLANTDVTSEARWQTSRILDPVTARVRDASGEVPHRYSLRVAHDLPQQHLSVGLTGDLSGAHTAYQVREVSTTASGGSLGAFLAFTPGPYQLNLNVSGLCGSSTTDQFYRDSRLSPEPDRTMLQSNSGPMLSLSLHKPL